MKNIGVQSQASRFTNFPEVQNRKGTESGLCVHKHVSCNLSSKSLVQSSELFSNDATFHSITNLLLKSHNLSKSHTISPKVSVNN